MILLDTTILVYALGTEHPLRAPSRALVELVRDGVVRACTTVEVVQEFAHVRSRRRPRAEAAARAKEYAVGFSPLTRPDEDDVFRGLDLFADPGGLGPVDAVLAATALRRAWSLASADRSFGQVKGLVYLDPSSPAFLDHVRATG
ncbi:MAG: type II toxin-antitoxin system VapC family toxin [Candidatus Dormibacteria bacterium]